MAKRFIDTGLFDDEWFSSISVNAKLFWLYFITKCDHAGLLKYNQGLIEYQTGIKSLATVTEELGNRLVRVKEHLLFCPKFISFQYPGFPKSGVKQQEGAITLLSAAGLWDTKNHRFKDLPNSYLTLDKELPNSYVYDNDNGNGNDNVKNKESEIELKLKGAIDEIYIDQQRGKWGHINFDFELDAFKNKVIGSPEKYSAHDTGGIRLAFQSQLRNAKKEYKAGNKQKDGFVS